MAYLEEIISMLKDINIYIISLFIFIVLGFSILIYKINKLEEIIKKLEK